MRGVRAALPALLLLSVAPAWGGPPPPEPVRVSGPSPFPEQGCGQRDPNAAALAAGDVAGFAASPFYGTERGQELDLSVVTDPRDRRRVTAAWVQDSAYGFVVARSTDGGRTFTRPAIVPRVTVCSGGTAQHVTHARLSAGPDGRLFLAGETLDGYFPDARSGVNRVIVLSSTDGGATWSPPSFVDDAPVFNGFDTIAAEPDVPGAALVAWHVPEPVATSYVSRTTDGGRTWTRSTVPGGPPDGLPSQRVVALGAGRLVLVTAEGTLRGFFDGSRPPLVVRRSDDAGRTWSAPTTLAAAAPGQWAAAAAGPGGLVHVAWYDDADPCGRRLLSRTSPDGGRTWRPTRTALCGVVGPMTDLAVLPDGTVGAPVTVAAPDGGQQVLATSRDAGTTWTAQPLGGAFALPAASGFFHGAAAGRRGFLSLHLRGGAGQDGPSDVFLSRSR